MKCPYCNKEIEDDSIFCPVCGSKVEVEVSIEQEGEYCPFCGKFNESGTMFCMGCGKRLDDEENCSNRKSKKGTVFVLIILLVVLFFGVFGGTYLLLKLRDDMNDKKFNIKVEESVTKEDTGKEDAEKEEEAVVEEELKEDALEEERLEEERLEQERIEQEVLEYILPSSSEKLLTEEDINYLSAKELNYARNEIYARHGRRFKSVELQNYFESKDWYVGSYSPTEFDEQFSDVITDIEKKNIDLIKEREKALGGYKVE